MFPTNEHLLISSFLDNELLFLINKNKGKSLHHSGGVRVKLLNIKTGDVDLSQSNQKRFHSTQKFCG